MKVPEHMRELYREARASGWTIAYTNGNHIRWTPPHGGSIIITGTTPGRKYGHGTDADRVRIALRRQRQAAEKEKEKEEKRKQEQLRSREPALVPAALMGKEKRGKEETVPKVGDIATIRPGKTEKPEPARPLKLPQVNTRQELAYSAFCVREACLEEAKKQHGKPHNWTSDVTGQVYPGVEWQGFMSDVFRRIWPDLRREERKPGSVSPGESAERAINAYLKKTANMTCLKSGTRRSTPAQKSIWWIGSQWHETPERGGIHLPLAPTKREERLTPQEAGEDRVPDEVTTTYRCPTCGEGPFRGLHSLHRHQFSKHLSVEDLVLEVLAAPDVPLPAEGYLIAARAKALGYPGGPEVVRKRLSKLSTEKPPRVAVVYRTKGGNPYYILPSRLAEIPVSFHDPRLPCRDPGCPEEFPTHWARVAHEVGAHVDSKFRAWRCLVSDTCREVFYDEQPLTVHLIKVHKLRGGSQELEAAKEMSRREYAQVEEELTAEAERLKAASAGRTEVPEPEAEVPVPASEPEPAASEPEPAASPAPVSATEVPAPSLGGDLTGQARSAVSFIENLVEQLHRTETRVAALEQDLATVTAERNSLKTELDRLAKLRQLLEAAKGL